MKKVKISICIAIILLFNVDFILAKEKAEEYYEAGLECLNNKEFDEAIANFKKAVADEENPTYIFSLGLAYYKKGMVNSAIDMYRHSIEKAISLNSDFALPHHALGEAYVSIAFYDEAIEEFEKAVVLDPKSVVYQSSLAWGYSEKGLKATAIEEYKKALMIDPRYFPARYTLGLLYFESHEYDNAIQQFKEAIKLTPDSISTHLALGQLYNIKGSHEAAIEELNKALRLDSNSKEVHIYLGEVYYKMGVPDKAILEYEMALSLGSQEAVVFYNLACLYSLKHDVSNAIKNLKKAIELDYKLKENARVDPDFQNISNTYAFKELIFY